MIEQQSETEASTVNPIMIGAIAMIFVVGIGTGLLINKKIRMYKLMKGTSEDVSFNIS